MPRTLIFAASSARCDFPAWRHDWPSFGPLVPGFDAAKPPSSTSNERGFVENGVEIYEFDV
jgi:hypothetical protein